VLCIKFHKSAALLSEISDPFSVVDLLLTNYINVTKLYMWQQMSCNKVLLWKLVQNFTAFNKTRVFITIFTTACNLFMSSSSWTQSTPIILLLQVHFNNILYLLTFLPGLPFASLFPTKNFAYISRLPYACHVLHQSFPPWFNHRHNILYTLLKHDFLPVLNT